MVLSREQQSTALPSAPPSGPAARCMPPPLPAAARAAAAARMLRGLLLQQPAARHCSRRAASSMQPSLPSAAAAAAPTEASPAASAAREAKAALRKAIKQQLRQLAPQHMQQQSERQRPRSSACLALPRLGARTQPCHRRCGGRQRRRRHRAARHRLPAVPGRQQRWAVHHVRAPARGRHVGAAGGSAGGRQAAATLLGARSRMPHAPEAAVGQLACVGMCCRSGMPMHAHAARAAMHAQASVFMCRWLRTASPTCRCCR